MTTDAAATAAPETPRPTPTWAIATVSALFGLFYAYALWQAIGNLIGANAAAASLGFGLNTMGWFIWIFAILFPAIVFGAAFALGYRRGILSFALILLTGLALVAVFWLNVVAYTSLNALTLIG